VLYVGTEFGIWVSINRGGDWTRLNGNLPTVAIHEIAQHATSGEIVVGTHGRSLWVLDVTPIRQMKAENVTADAHLLRPNAVVRWARRHSHGRTGGARRFTGENPPTSASIYYSLGKNARSIRLTVRDAGDEVLATLDADAKKGLHRLSWGLTKTPSAAERADRERRLRERFGADWQRYQRYFRGRGSRVADGTYEIVLEVDGKTFREPIEILPDPELPNAPQGRRRGEED
jgi:hypothetical protein